MKSLSTKQRDQKIIITDKDVIKVISIEDILYFSCESYITTIHTVDKGKISIVKLLKHFEEDLAAFGFFRINRNYLVNMKYVDAIHTAGNAFVELFNHTKLAISCRKLSPFKRALSDCVMNKV